MRRLIATVLVCLGGLVLTGCASHGPFAARPPKAKRALVVTVTTEFRHSSIKTAEAVLAKLAEQSGAFTVDYVQQPPNRPEEPRKPNEPAKPKPDSDPEKQQAAQEKYEKAKEKY